jgi:hypothetical protein
LLFLFTVSGKKSSLVIDIIPIEIMYHPDANRIERNQTFETLEEYIARGGLIVLCDKRTEVVTPEFPIKPKGKSMRPIGQGCLRVPKYGVD